jgi:hypothetical protein
MLVNQCSEKPTNLPPEQWNILFLETWLCLRKNPLTLNDCQSELLIIKFPLKLHSTYDDGP